MSAEGNIDGSETLKPFRNKCHVIPFAVSNEMVAEGRKYYERQTKRDDSKVHVLFIGRFVWYKGIDILLNAFSKLDQDKYELTLVGTGPMFADMKQLSKRLGLNNATFAGSVSEEEKIDWIKWSDFLVLPSVSKAEAFAIVQIEAMAFGKPVINTWLPSGVPDVSRNAKTGITVDAGDGNALKNAIRKLGENIDLRVSYGKRAIECVEENYSMNVLVDRYSTFFEKMVN